MEPWLFGTQKSDMPKYLKRGRCVLGNTDSYCPKLQTSHHCHDLQLPHLNNSDKKFSVCFGKKYIEFLFFLK